MDQITVPQFIENEDRILGPITVRQFVIMFVAAIVLFAFFKFTDFSIFLFACLTIGGGASIIAFLKINGQPFHYFLLHILETLRRPSLRVWRRSTRKDGITLHWGRTKRQPDEEQEPTPIPPHSRLSDRKLSELALVLDTGGAYHGEYEDGTELFHPEKFEARNPKSETNSNG